jgi:hypothetical protein
MATTTYDLSACSCCGGGSVPSVCGCSSVPTNLHATYTGSPEAAIPNGSSFLLPYDSGTGTWRRADLGVTAGVDRYITFSCGTLAGASPYLLTDLIDAGTGSLIKSYTGLGGALYLTCSPFVADMPAFRLDDYGTSPPTITNPVSGMTATVTA